MSRPPTDELIDRLAAQARPVRPLRPPLKRALVALSALVGAGAVIVAAMGDPAGLAARYAGRESMMAIEMVAMGLTALLALIGAFTVSIPGRSRLWLLAPLPPASLWIGLSGLGCYAELLRSGSAGTLPGDSLHCFSFLIAASLLVGLPLFWQLARARPVDPLPVAALGGLGAAAASAFLLQFFHPFALTLVDLGVHLLAVLLIVGAASLSRRLALSPA